MFLRYQVLQVFVMFSAIALAVSDCAAKEKFKVKKEKFKEMKEKFKETNKKKKNV